MDSKTKLYVFAKKEVFLIFLFMILTAVTSFVLGVKIGKNYSMEMYGITKEDQKKVVDLLSSKEEALEAIKANPEMSTIESSEIENKLQEKISEEFGAGEAPTNMTTAHSTPKESKENAKESVKDELSGKFTIQIGSHRTLKEAEAFAEGFRARGYNPIINQIEIKGKGTWYRVSLEAFDSAEDAKAYVTKEKSLFLGQDYAIIKMP